MLADDLIRPIAHKIWIIEGQPDGRALDHWLEARRVALAADVAQPWYETSRLVDEPTWLRRAVWTPQPYLQ
jgi:hypothetical protein